MTEEQVVQALQICATNTTCDSCPARSVNKCTKYVMQQAMDIIGGLKEDNEWLTKELNRIVNKFYGGG